MPSRSKICSRGGRHAAKASAHSRAWERSTELTPGARSAQNMEGSAEMDQEVIVYTQSG